MFLDSIFGIDILGDGDPDFLDDAVIMDMIEGDEEEDATIPDILEDGEDEFI